MKKCGVSCSCVMYSDRSAINHKTNSCLASFSLYVPLKLIFIVWAFAHASPLRCDQAKRAPTLINYYDYYMCVVVVLSPKIITFMRIWVIVCNLSVYFSPRFLHFVCCSWLLFWVRRYSGHVKCRFAFVCRLIANFFLCDCFLCGSKFIFSFFFFISLSLGVCMCFVSALFFYAQYTGHIHPNNADFGSAMGFTAAYMCARDKILFVFYSLILCKLFLWVWIHIQTEDNK